MPRRLLAVTVALALIGAPALAAKAPDTWDGLTRVKSKNADAVYLLPGADFKPYTKVMIDPTEVAFAKNWQRDYNNATVGLSNRISDEQAQRILEAARTGFDRVFREEYEKAGYQVVTSPGADVLRVRTAVINLQVDAPDTQPVNIQRSYSREAGEATLVLEARDSTSGALLGRAIDAQLVGEGPTYIRNAVTNRADFERLFKAWARTSARGLDRLKSQAPLAR